MFRVYSGFFLLILMAPKTSTGRIFKMEISDIKIRRLYHEDRMKAIVSVTIEDLLVIHDIKVIEVDGREFIAMPSRRTEDGKYRDIVHPIQAGFRNELESRVLAAYHQALKEADDINSL